MRGFLGFRASRWVHVAALSAFGALSVVACAKGGGGPAGSNGIGGGGGTITGAGGHASMSGPTGSSSGNPTSTSSGPGVGGGVTTTSSSGTGGACSVSPCKLSSPQCGCPGGKECNLDANDMIACVDAGTAAEGQSCNSIGDCAPGLICLAASQTANACGKFCDVDGDCTGGFCVVSLANGSGMTIPNVTLCSKTCDPVTNSGCTVSGSSCQVGQQATGSMRWFTSCYPAGNGGQGAACTSSANCLPREWCINNGTSNVCSTYCNVNSPSCPGGTSCAGVTDQNGQPIVVNGVTYGACL